MTFDWDEIEESAPVYGGVYIMTDENDQVVYVIKTGRLGSFKKQLLEQRIRLLAAIRELAGKYLPEFNRFVGYVFRR